VDDNRDAARMMELLLRDMGYEARSAATGVAAIEAARAFVPEVALIDIVLPDVDGCELARDLRGLPGWAGARIVAITAYDDDRARQRALDAGCNDYYLKPIAPMVLNHILSRLGHRHVGDDGTRMELAGTPQFLDGEERSEVTAIVRALDPVHPVRYAFEDGVDTRRLARIAEGALRDRLHAAYTAAIRRFTAKG
jgi:CheY-like chemotaxis protein